MCFFCVELLIVFKTLLRSDSKLLIFFHSLIFWISSFFLIFIAFWQFYFFLSQLNWDLNSLFFKFISLIVLIFILKIVSNKNIIFNIIFLITLTFCWFTFLNLWNQIGWVRWIINVTIPILIKVIEKEFIFYVPILIISVLSYLIFRKWFSHTESFLISIIIVFLGLVPVSFIFYYSLAGPSCNKIYDQNNLEPIFWSNKCREKPFYSKSIPIDMTHNRQIFLDDDKKEIYFSMGSTFNFLYNKNPILCKVSVNDNLNYQCVIGGVVRNFYPSSYSDYIYAIDWDLNLFYIISKEKFLILKRFQLSENFKEPIQLIVNEDNQSISILSTTNVFLDQYHLPPIPSNISQSNNDIFQKTIDDYDSSRFNSHKNKSFHIIKRFLKVLINNFLNYFDIYLFPDYINNSTNKKSDHNDKLIQIKRLDFLNEHIIKFGDQGYMLLENKNKNYYYVFIADKISKRLLINSNNMKIEKVFHFDDLVSAASIGNNSIFVAYLLKGKIIEYDLNDFSVKSIFQSHPFIFNIIVDNQRNLLYLSDYRQGKLLILNKTNGKIIKSFLVGNKPRGLFLTPDNQSLYIMSSYGVFRLNLSSINTEIYSK